MAAAIDGHHPWQHLDEQLVVSHTIMADIRQACNEGTKKAIIIRGVPVTGKSVVAAQIVRLAAKEGFGIAHATGSEPLATNLRGFVGEKVEAAFRNTHSFRDTAKSMVHLVAA